MRETICLLRLGITRGTCFVWGKCQVVKRELFQEGCEGKKLSDTQLIIDLKCEYSL